MVATIIHTPESGGNPLQKHGVISEPFNPLASAIALDASFVARAWIGDPEGTREILERAIRHRGFALVDIFQPCVTFNRLNTHQWFREHTYHLEEDYDPSDRVAAFARAIETERYPLGVFYLHPERETFEAAVIDPRRDCSIYREAADRAGFEDVSIVLSNQLDEARIRRIDERIAEEAPGRGVDSNRLIDRLVFGVGTRLITSEGCGALDGVCKLTAVRKDGEWRPAFKISETPDKTINPGEKRAWRVYGPGGKASGDFLSRAGEDPRQENELTLRHPVDPHRVTVLKREEISTIEPLLEPVLQDGREVKELPSIEEIRRTRRADLERLPDGVKKIFDPDPYPVFLTERLWQLKQELLSTYRQQ